MASFMITKFNGHHIPHMQLLGEKDIGGSRDLVDMLYSHIARALGVLETI